MTASGTRTLLSARLVKRIQKDMRKIGRMLKRRWIGLKRDFCATELQVTPCIVLGDSDNDGRSLSFMFKTLSIDAIWHATELHLVSAVFARCCRPTHDDIFVIYRYISTRGSHVRTCTGQDNQSRITEFT